MSDLETSALSALRHAATAAPRAGWRTAWPLPVLVALVFAVYWPGRGGGFVFDDFPNIVNNAAVHVTSWNPHAWLAALLSSESGPFQRPLSMASFALNHVFTGLDPVAMKLTNVLIHCVNACLVLGLLGTLLALARPDGSGRRQVWAARFTAAAWALHPINFLAVLYVVQRMESLCHTFVFAGLWLYLLGRQRQLAGQRGGWPRIVAGIVGGTALGALCKESAVLLPLYAACVELCVLGARAANGSRDRRLLVFFAIVLVMPAVVGLAWLLPKTLEPGAYANRDFTLGERLLTEGRVVLDYLRWSLFPSLRGLSLYHDDIVVSHGLWQPPATAFALAGLLALGTVAAVAKTPRPLVALGILWFLGAQLPTATIIPLELVYEHRNYFASLGICLAIGDLLLFAPRREGARRVAMLIAVLWLLMLALTTTFRSKEWSDPLRFAASEAAKNPRSPRSAYEYARLLVIATGYQADSPLMPQALDALERDRALPGSGILPHSALATLMARTGQRVPDSWWDDMVLRLRENPIGAEETSAIASITMCARDGDCAFPRQAMLAMYQAALSHGANAELMNIQADYVFNVLHDPEAALDLWRQAIALRPGETQYRVNRIKILIAIGRKDQARTEIAALRRSGFPGKTELAARELEQRMGPPNDQSTH
jgi:hypothetical protein